MKTPHATEEEVRKVAEKLLGPIVSDLRAQIIKLRAEALRRDQAQDERLAQYLQAAKAANDQEKRTRDRERAVLQRLANLENKR